MPEDIDRKSNNNEKYDTYDGTAWAGGIVDNPHVHIYIAHQIPDTVTEGEQYEPPTPTTPGLSDEESDETEDTSETTENT